MSRGLHQRSVGFLGAVWTYQAERMTNNPFAIRIWNPWKEISDGRIGLLVDVLLLSWYGLWPARGHRLRVLVGDLVTESGKLSSRFFDYTGADMKTNAVQVLAQFLKFRHVVSRICILWLDLFHEGQCA